MKTFVRHILAAVVLAQTAFFIAPVAAHGNHSRHGQSAETPFGHPGKPANITRTINVAMDDTMRFTPNGIDVQQGETLRLHITNKGKIVHEFVLGNKDELQEHADMMKRMPGMKHTDANAISVASGQTGDVVWTFSKAGTFLYACLVPGHWEAGMEGHVNVAPQSKP